MLSAMQLLKEEFGNKFSQVFKTITVDNGPEFSGFAQVENWGSQVYFAHPYTSWERPQRAVPGLRAQGSIHWILFSRVHLICR